MLHHIIITLFIQFTLNLIRCLILGIYRLAFEQPKLGIPKEYLATKVLPALWPMTVEPGLNLVQLEALIQLIRDMSSKVETAQKLTLKSSMDISLEHK